MNSSASKRPALRITAAAVATAAAVVGLGATPAAAAAAPVLMYQQQWSGTAPQRVSNAFPAPAPTLWIGGSCAAAPGASATANVGLFDDNLNTFIAQTGNMPCNNTITATPMSIPHNTTHTYQMVMVINGPATSQGVYAWR